MYYKVSNLITQIKTRAKDSSLSDDQIVDWLQEVQDSVLGHYRLPFLECVEDDYLATGQTAYDLPDDFQVLSNLAIVVENNSIMTPHYMTPHEFDDCYPVPDNYPKQRPIEYTIYGNALHWQAPVDQTYKIRFKYVRRPCTLTTTSTPDIPIEYKRILIDGTLAMIESYRGNFDIAAVYDRAVEDAAEDMVFRYSDRQLIQPHKSSLLGKVPNRHA